MTTGNTQAFFQAIDAAKAAVEKMPGGYAEHFDALQCLEDAESAVEELVKGAEVIHNSTAVKWYDDGYGQLYVYSETIGVCGVVRAKSWESAYEICQDEIMDGSSFAEMIEDCGLTPEDVAAIEKGGDLPDGYAYRSNSDGGKCLCVEDVNGSALDLLTPELAETLGLTVNVRFEVK